MKTQILTLQKEKQVKVVLTVIKLFSALFIVFMALASIFM